MTNTGAAALPHVSASDLLPGGMSYLSSSPEGTNQGQKVFWPDIGPMAQVRNRQLKSLPESQARYQTRHSPTRLR